MNSKNNSRSGRNSTNRRVVKRKVSIQGIKNDDHPYVRFDRRLKLKGLDKKRCKENIFPELEELFSIERTRKAGLRFAEVLIANMLDAYRDDVNNPSGVELAQSKDSYKSIQSKGMRKISEYTVEAVLGWLCENGYAQKIRAVKTCDANEIYGRLVLSNWKNARSSVFVATRSLIDLVTAPTVGNSKVCKTCGKDKSLSEYTKQRNGYEAECKACRAERKRMKRKMKMAA